jgi:hypothetical protein
MRALRSGLVEYREAEGSAKLLLAVVECAECALGFLADEKGQERHKKDLSLIRDWPLWPQSGYLVQQTQQQKDGRS